MTTEINTLTELVTAANESEGYMAGITLIKNGELKHYFFSDKFPFADMLKSHSKVKDLVVRMLEEDPRIAV